jgi:hypothetical protein
MKLMIILLEINKNHIDSNKNNIYIYIMQQKRGKKQYSIRIGSRAQVMHGTALMTSGGLKKKTLNIIIKVRL